MSFLAFANNDLVPQVQGVLTSQLFLDEIISLTEFNARVASTPDYPIIIHQNDIHLLVLDTYYNLTIDRSVFDFCFFMKDGQAAVLHCHGYGAPGISFPIAYLTIDQLRHHFPLCGCWHPWDGYGCCNNPPIQNNILFPLECKVCKPLSFPFGESCNGELQPLPNPYNLPISCFCNDKFPWVGGG
jgi:hypothetical protein